MNRHNYQHQMSITSTDPRVPVELQFNIIDWVNVLGSDGNKSLMVCASVSRSWHRMVSKHAFRLVVFTDPGDTDRFKDLVEGNPYITTAVTQICICEPYPSFNALRDIPWALETLAGLSGVLPDVGSIILMGFQFVGDFYDPHSFQSSISYPQCMRLEIMGCLFPAPVFRLFLSAFQSLRDLGLYGLMHAHPESKSCALPHLPDPPLPSLSRIRLRAVGGNHNTFPILISPNAAHNLHDLSISIRSWLSDDRKGADEVLVSLGSSLTSLELKFVDGSEGFHYDYSTPLSL